MAKNVEETLNVKLGELLIARHPRWSHENVHAERTGTLLNHPLKKIDVLIENPSGQPVAVETEFVAGPQVRREAESRLGLKLSSDMAINPGEPIESSISVVFPDALRKGDPAKLGDIAFRYATHHCADNGTPQRWPPERQWLKGTVDDLADAIEAVSLSQRLITDRTNRLQRAIETATGHLRSRVSQSVLDNIADELRQKDEEQTTRMAVAILVSAFVFHYGIEGKADGIPSTDSDDGTYTKRGTLDSWRSILKVNYEPIFSVAVKILRHIPAVTAGSLLKTIDDAANKLATIGATTFHDLAGAAFQTLIADRNFLATYYTRPESAYLLAELAVDRLSVDWSDRNAISSLRIADFACGTGALLSAAQRAIYRRYRRAGGDDAEIHSVTLEQVISGTDIMPAAAHLTASMLSSAHPGESYGASNIHTLPYGRDARWGISIGALDLAVEDRVLSLFGTGEERLRGTKRGPAGGSPQHIRAKDASYDLIIMNPPFTRPTGHEAERRGIPVPAFAAFGTSSEDQSDMSDKLARMPSLFGHGNAGLASNFMDLSHAKLKEGGILALVLPFTFVIGKAWEKARVALHSEYRDIAVVSISEVRSRDRSFSADTGMAEVLVLATKRQGRPTKASFCNIRARPSNFLEAAVAAKDIANGAEVIKNSILDGGAAGVASLSVARAAQSLARGKLKLPTMVNTIALPIASLGSVADRGPYHMDISSRAPRGPFDKRDIRSREVPTYPMLWGHDAERERSLTVAPDQCGVVRTDRAGREAEADELWSTASRLHYNRDFRTNSQSLAACLTPENSLGGISWPSFKPENSEHEFPLALWANTTLGLLTYWWHGTRQQQGRTRTSITALPELPVLDVDGLLQKQLNLAKRIFSAFETQEFWPANEAYRDKTRKALDRAVLVDLMNLPSEVLGPLAKLRNQWCAEPTVHGGKRTRISESLVRQSVAGSNDQEEEAAFYAEIAAMWKPKRRAR